MSKKWISGILTTLVLAAALAGCGTATKQQPQPAAPAQSQPAAPAPKEPVTLTVQCPMTENECKELKAQGEAWAAKTGNKITFQVVEAKFQDYIPQAQAGKAPDLYVGMPHDNLGTFHKAGLLEPVPAGVIPADTEKVGIEAVSYDGKQFAVPLAMEAVALFYNKALVPNPPKTWDEFLKTAQEKGFAYNLKDFYFSFGFINGMGGYVFKSTGGGLDPKDIGLANDGAKAGYALLGDLVHKHGFMKIDVDYNAAKDAFIKGKAGLHINGAWEVSAFKDAKIDFGVAPVPTLPNGKPFAPFVGVQTAFVAPSSKNKAEAWDLMKHYVANAPLMFFKVNSRIPVYKSLLDSADVKSNPIISGFAAQAALGTPMPNIPQMSQVWGPAADAIKLVVEQKANAAQVTTDAVKKINEGIAGMK